MKEMTPEGKAEELYTPHDNMFMAKRKAFVEGANWQSSYREALGGCGICGGSLVEIRGKYPGDEKRKVCATCNTERLDQINEISSKTYGVAMKNDSTALGEKEVGNG